MNDSRAAVFVAISLLLLTALGSAWAMFALGALGAACFVWTQPRPHSRWVSQLLVMGVAVGIAIFAARVAAGL